MSQNMRSKNDQNVLQQIVDSMTLLCPKTCTRKRSKPVRNRKIQHLNCGSLEICRSSSRRILVLYMQAKLQTRIIKFARWTARVLVGKRCIRMFWKSIAIICENCMCSDFTHHSALRTTTLYVFLNTTTCSDLTAHAATITC